MKLKILLACGLAVVFAGCGGKGSSSSSGDSGCNTNATVDTEFREGFAAVDRSVNPVSYRYVNDTAGTAFTWHVKDASQSGFTPQTAEEQAKTAQTRPVLDQEHLTVTDETGALIHLSQGVRAADGSIAYAFDVPMSEQQRTQLVHDTETSLVSGSKGQVQKVCGVTQPKGELKIENAGAKATMIVRFTLNLQVADPDGLSARLKRGQH